MRTTVLMGCMCSLILASGWVAAQTRPENVKHGQQIYQRHCLRCHGEALDGKGPDAGSISVPPANFHTHLSRMKDDFELRLTIQRGRMFTAMHQWDDILTDEQIRDVVSYIRSVVPHEKP